MSSLASFHEAGTLIQLLQKGPSLACRSVLIDIVIFLEGYIEPVPFYKGVNIDLNDFQQLTVTKETGAMLWQRQSQSKWA